MHKIHTVKQFSFKQQREYAPENVSRQNNEPVRRSVTRSQPRVRGKFPSTKMGRMISCESQLEQHFCYYAEFTRPIIKYREQPVKIQFTINGNVCSYTPDFELIFDDGSCWYVEIKPLKSLNNPDLLERWRSIDAVCREHDFKFIVVTDEEIRNETRLRNLKLLRANQRLELEKEEYQLVRYVISNNEIIDISDLNKVLCSTSKCFALIAKGYLSFNINTPLQLDTPVNLNQDKNDETCLFNYRVAPDYKQCSLSDLSKNGEWRLPLREKK